MVRSTIWLVGVGGALGASLRWALGTTIASGDFPTATLVANVVGAGLVGWLIAARPGPKVLALLATGFCGGLTTMSTFSLETARFVDDGRLALGAVYFLASLLLGALAWWLGRRLGLDRAS